MKSEVSGNHIVLIVGRVEEGAACSLSEQLPWRVGRVKNYAGATLLLFYGTPRVVISEQNLPDGDWKNVVNAANLLPCPPPVIVTSRLADERLWAEVLNLGGYDVLAQPLDGEEVRRVTGSAWQQWANRQDAARRSKSATHIAATHFLEVANVR
jgi:DNA-binding NtrC family response regulator